MLLLMLVVMRVQGTAVLQPTICGTQHTVAPAGCPWLRPLRGVRLLQCWLLLLLLLWMRSPV